jgi:hypothetical protein
MKFRILAGAASLAMLSAATATYGQNLLDSNPASLTYNNPSFESPDVSSVGIGADKWTASGPTLDPGLGFQVLAGAGIFENPPVGDPQHLNGMTGTQAAYLFANSFVSGSDPTGPALDHAFTQVTQLTYTAGQQYRLSVDVANASSAPPANSTLTISLFAVDAGAPGGEIPLASTAIVNDGSTALNGASFTPFLADTGVIGASAAGKPIGIRLMTHTPPANPSITGQFDLDNIQVSVVPEPTGLALVIGAAGLLGARRRRSC